MDDDVHNLITQHVQECRREVDGKFRDIHDSLDVFRTELIELRSEMHRASLSINEISASLKNIADSMNRLSDFPETWAKVKGFWSVIDWLRANVMTIAVLVLVLLFLGDLISLSSLADKFGSH